MDLKDIYLPVEKVKVDDILPGYQHQSGNEYATIVTRPDGKKLIANFCSKIYHLVRNEEVIEPFLREIQKHWAVKPVVHMNEFNTQFFVDFVLTQNGVEMDRQLDMVFPKVRLHNSYDGRVRYHFTIGFHRLVCTNGLTVPEGEQFKIRKLHTPSLADLTSFEKVMEMTSGFLEQSLELSGTYFELLDNSVKDADRRIEQVIDDTSFPVSLEQDVKSRVRDEMQILDMKVPNDWLVYNAFNYQLNHNDGFKAKETKREDLDAEVMKYLLEY